MTTNPGLRRWASLALAFAAFLAGWAARVPEVPIPQVVTRMVRAPTRTVEIAAQPSPDPVTTACAEADRAAMGLLGLPEEVAPELPATESACRDRIALATAVTTARQYERFGTPMPFPEDLPEEYREAAITRVARVVESTCPDVDLRRVDCSEFPCLAVFVTGPEASGGVVGCPAWTDAYGDGSTTFDETLIGANGEKLKYALVGPAIPPRFLPPPEPPQDYEPVITDNSMKRLILRGESAKDEVMAALGAREPTEAENRERTRRKWSDRAAAGDEKAAQFLEMMEEQWAAEDARPADAPP